jgi:hypothetical protein
MSSIEILWIPFPSKKCGKNGGRAIQNEITVQLNRYNPDMGSPWDDVKKHILKRS